MQQTELRRPPAARNGQLAASEVSEFTDSITGCAVRQLTGAALRSVHSYYDIPPWSPTSGQIAFTRLAAEGSGGDICIMERDGSDLRTVAQTREVTPNDGAYPQWSADGERVYFRDRDGDRQLVGVLEAASGRVERLSGSLRMLSPAGHHSAFHTAFDRLPDHVVRDGKADHGVFVQDLASGVSRRLVSCADCLALHPRRTEVAGWHLYLKHCKWSPDGSRLLFVFTNEIRYADKYGELPRVKDVYVIDADGSGLRRVGEFGNHPIWHPNGCEVLTNSPYPGRPGNSLGADRRGQRRAATRLRRDCRQRPPVVLARRQHDRGRSRPAARGVRIDRPGAYGGRSRRAPGGDARAGPLARRHPPAPGVVARRPPAALRQRRLRLCATLCRRRSRLNWLLPLVVSGRGAAPIHGTPRAGVCRSCSLAGGEMPGDD